MAINNALNSKSTGIQVLASTGVFTGVTVTGTSNQISLSNGDGTGGNPTASLTTNIQVSGISFDSGSNTLSAYSTGTFTIVINGGTSNPTPTYTVQVGRYTKVGNRVFISFHVAISNISGGSGQVQLATLPFTSQATTDNKALGGMFFANVTFGTNAKFYSTRVNENVTIMVMSFSRTGAGVGSSAIADLTTTSDITGSVIYEV